MSDRDFFADVPPAPERDDGHTVDASVHDLADVTRRMSPPVTAAPRGHARRVVALAARRHTPRRRPSMPALRRPRFRRTTTRGAGAAAVAALVGAAVAAVTLGSSHSAAPGEDGRAASTPAAASAPSISSSAPAVPERPLWPARAEVPARMTAPEPQVPRHSKRRAAQHEAPRARLAQRAEQPRARRRAQAIARSPTPVTAPVSPPPTARAPVARHRFTPGDLPPAQ